MAVKEVKLNQAALKLLAEYSEAEGVSPSKAVLRFIPKPRKMGVAVKRTRARAALGKLSDEISTRANLSEKEVMARLKK